MQAREGRWPRRRLNDCMLLASTDLEQPLWLPQVDLGTVTAIPRLITRRVEETTLVPHHHRRAVALPDPPHQRMR